MLYRKSALFLIISIFLLHMFLIQISPVQVNVSVIFFKMFRLLFFWNVLFSQLQPGLPGLEVNQWFASRSKISEVGLACSHRNSLSSVYGSILYGVLDLFNSFSSWLKVFLTYPLLWSSVVWSLSLTTACFTGTDISLVHILRNNSNKLQMSTRGFVHELIMQQNREAHYTSAFDFLNWKHSIKKEHQDSHGLFRLDRANSTQFYYLMVMSQPRNIFPPVLILGLLK